ncbi:DinB family protein [uncultured Algibacter sp.]|uniref:DinB family protein n=1 Tax=uncultured Algibacter sp. TaxID=298659 RepID=UPI0026156B43|nr:DinB family protein [uncultured Algibacter sp.]
MTVTDLNTSEYHAFYETYISKVPKDIDLIEGFKIGGEQLISFFNQIPIDKLEYRYELGKWSIKEVLQHIIDTERIFIYRCFRIARHDKTKLTGFEQDDYIEPSRAHSKSIESLLEEYQVVRQNSIVLLKSLSEANLKYLGNASNTMLSARAAAFMTLGHEIHHRHIVKERYLV